MPRPVIGIDVGENSVGLASVLVDDAGMPTAIHAALSVLHDGGIDGMASGQSAKVSRKASGGAARRVRRLYRNRRRRRLALEAALVKRGYPVTDPAELGTYSEWQARLDLLDGFIADDAERRRLLAIAVLHMSNHRGWANAWVPLDAYLRKEEPSAEFVEAVKKAVDRGLLPSQDAAATLAVAAKSAEQAKKKDPAEREPITADDVAEVLFQADLVGCAFDDGVDPTAVSMRPRTHERGGGRKSVAKTQDFYLLGVQRRVDVVREWKRICETQRIDVNSVDGDFEVLGRIAFAQERPQVPSENVGRDWIPQFKDRPRASVASLEHQEFQIRQTVANLAIRTGRSRKDRRPLTVEEQNVVVDTLMGVTDKKTVPTWQDIAEDFLGIEPRALVSADPEQSIGASAPVLRSALTMWSIPAKHPVAVWWRENRDQHAEFVRWFADPTKSAGGDRRDKVFGPLFEGLDEKQSDAVAGLKFPSGRSAHCVEALRLMNAEIARTGDPYITVRNRLFNGGKHMTPPPSTLDVVADHPTLQRVLPPVRRFVQAVIHEHGQPERVVVEHVRGAFLGFAAKHEEAMRQRRNRRDRERVIEHIRAAYGEMNPRNDLIRKVQAYERQNCQCLYCGATPGLSGMEMDHIVARARGGNSTRANLVAVCRDCNEVKGKQPFAVFAESGLRPGVSLDGALHRVKSLSNPGNTLDARVFGKLKAEMSRRLKQRELDDDIIDERTLGSTAYAAVDMRDRIMGSHNLEIGDVPVYPGRIVQAARRASGIDKKLRLRAGVDVKSRFDRRHHAIDALVAAMLNPSVARTLAEREDMRTAAFDTGDTTEAWKEYEGSGPAAIEKYRAWVGAMNRLADLVAAEVAADRIPVVSPVRFSAHHAALHKDGRVRHARKPLGAAWSAAERALIVDDRVYERLSDGVPPGADLPADPTRTLVLPSGVRLDADGDVYVFPDTAARIVLPNRSSAELGASIHHARIYRWTDARGRVAAGVVRLFASDLYDLEDGVEGDLLTSPLRESSRAARRAGPKVREALWSGAAELVGAILPGDELEIDPAEWGPDNVLGKFLERFPERHWVVTGLKDNGRLAARPLGLSQEGMWVRPDGATEEPDRQFVEVTAEDAKVIGDRVLISFSDLWSKPSTRIIRRTALGRVREGDGSGLPTSWAPHHRVHGG